MRSWSVVLTLVLGCGDNNNDDAADTDIADTDTDVADTDTDTDSDSDSDADSDADADPPASNARFINTSEEIGTVTVYVDTVALPVVPMLPAFAGTPFIPMPPGMHTFAVAAAMAPVAEAFGSSTAMYDVGKRYTNVVFGTVAAPVVTNVLEDIMNPPLAMGELRYRFWNVVDTIPTIDITEESTDTLLADDLAYGPATSTIDIPGGELSVLVDTNNDGVDEYRYLIPAVGANVAVSFFFTMQAGVPILLGQPAGPGAPNALQPEILVP